MARRYWIGVGAAEHVAHAVAAGFCAFAHGRESAVRKLSLGDRLVYYAPRTKLEGGEPVQRFVALGEVTGAAPYLEDGFWRRAAAYEDLGEAEVRPLLDRLSFVRRKDKWGMAFRRGQFEAPEADFALIRQAMAAGPKAPSKGPGKAEAG